MGELTRYVRTNTFASDFNTQVRLLFCHLRRLVYPQTFLDKCLLERNFDFQRVRKPQDTRSIVPFTLRFVSGAEKLHFTAIVARRLHLLGDSVDHVRILTAFRSSPNLFRLRFSRFLD